MTVVHKGIYSLLKHPFLISENDLWNFGIQKILQPIVPGDDPPVKVVEITGGKPSSLERHKGSKIGRNNGKNLKDHPLRTIAGKAKSLDDPEALEKFSPSFWRRL